MMQTGREELICDFAETYHIINMRELKPTMMATLAAGLREDSRIMMKLSGAKTDTKTLLLASISDRIGLQLWQKSRDGQKGMNQPKSIVTEITRDRKNDVVGYSNGADFLAERKRLMNG